MEPWQDSICIHPDLLCVRLCRLSKGIVHTFPSVSDTDQSPYIFDVNFSSSSNMAVSACGPGHLIKIYDRATLAPVQQLAGHQQKVNQVCFVDNEPNILLSASSDSSVKVWDLRAAGTLHSFHGGGKPYWCVDFDSSANLVGSGLSRSVKVMDWKTRKVVRSYNDVHTDDVTQTKFHLNRQPPASILVVRQ